MDFEGVLLQPSVGDSGMLMEVGLSVPGLIIQNISVWDPGIHTSDKSPR
jgi:hypothetical protein